MVFISGVPDTMIYFAIIASLLVFVLRNVHQAVSDRAARGRNTALTMR